MNKKIQRIALITSPLIGTLYMIPPTVFSGELPLGLILLMVFMGTIFVFFLWQIQIFLSDLKRYSLNRPTRFLVSIVPVAMMSTIIFFLQQSPLPSNFPLHLKPYLGLIRFVHAVIANFFVFTLFELFTHHERHENLKAEHQKLLLADAESKILLLKQQLNPHFLFNALNTLKSLIEIDKNQATDYTVKLAALLRTSIATGDKKTASISEEITLCRLFIEIQNIRFGGLIHFEYDVPQTSVHLKLPFFTLLLLAENAIKHNTILASRPLFIKLSIVDNELIFSNNTTPKISPPEGEGVGLKNLNKRYVLLFGKEIKIEKNEKEYVVKLLIINC